MIEFLRLSFGTELEPILMGAADEVLMHSDPAPMLDLPALRGSHRRGLILDPMKRPTQFEPDPSATYKAIPQPQRPTLLGRVVASAFVSSILPLSAQTILNPGFEEGPFPGGVGYGDITGWVGAPAGRTGSNTSAGPFADNGVIPEGTRVALIQSGGTPLSSIQTTLTNLTPGTKYHVGLRMNCRTGSASLRPLLQFSSSGTAPVVAAEIQAVTGANPYQYAGFDFTANAASETITLTNARPSGDSTVLVDDVKVTPSTGAWEFSPWNGDGDSGVSPHHVYTHAFDLGTGDSVYINGVNFTGRTTALAGSFSVTGLNNTAAFGVGIAQLTGGSAAMVKDFWYNGSPSITLQGLEPNTQYVFTVYTAGWDASNVLSRYRGATFSSSLGGERMTVDVNQYGQNKGLKLTYTYTTDANGSPVTISYPSTSLTTGTFHTSGFSNRKAQAMVGVAPIIGQQPAGAIINPGSNYVLSVSATGSEGFSYQWKRNNTDVPGATGSTLLLEAADAADSGDYTVVVTNGTGSATSAVASVLVAQKLPGGFPTGVNASGAVLAGGVADPHYTLITNPQSTASTTALVQSTPPGAWITNSTTSKWIGPLANTQFAAAMSTDAGEGPGTYVYRTQVDLTGQDANLPAIRIVGAWTSDNRGVAVRVNGVDSGIAEPSEGHFNLYRPFLINGGLVAGVNNIDFLVQNTDLTTGYTGLRVDALNVVVVPPNTVASIIRQPKGGQAIRNDTFTLSVDAFASASLTYQWYKGETAIDGETGAFLQLFADSGEIAGDYKVSVSDGVTTVMSTVATVTVPNNPPVVVADALATNSNTPLEIAPALDLAFNDTDPDGDVRTLASFSATSANGGTIVASDDLLIYTPPLNFVGVDTFTYTVKDNWGGTSAAGTVSITVTSVATPPGPVTLAVNLGGDSVTASFAGTPGSTYILQRSVALESNSWVDVDTEVAPETGAVVLIDSNPPEVNAFYRVSYTP